MTKISVISPENWQYYLNIKVLLGFSKVSLKSHTRLVYYYVHILVYRGIIQRAQNFANLGTVSPSPYISELVKQEKGGWNERVPKIFTLYVLFIYNSNMIEIFD